MSNEAKTTTCPRTAKLPALFVGHGSPMNAIECNELTRTWKKLGAELPRPLAILSISAHWETAGTQVTVASKQKTIHDFGGFPKELFEMQYPADGCPELAYEIKNMLKGEEITLSSSWGLDHGTWSILHHFYPEADIPVIQLSLDYYKTPQQHYELAKKLATLRRNGVLIFCSGNIVHNLSKVAWDKLDSLEYGHPWAKIANDTIREKIISGDIEALINYKKLGESVALAVPTPDHFLPLLYLMGVKEEGDSLEIFNDVLKLGSLSMLSVVIG